jgi:hypothetical protein
MVWLEKPMAITKRERPVIVDGTESSIIQDEQLFAAVVTATLYALEQYDDAAVLAIRQDQLVARLTAIVRDTIRITEAERFAGVKPRLLNRALRAYIAKEVRKRQSRAFEEQLAAEYGPLEQGDTASQAEPYTVINGISVIEVESVVKGDKPNRA